MKARLLTVRRLTGGSTRRLMEVGSWQLADAKQITGTDEWSAAVDSILSVLCRRYLFNSVAILRSILDMITCSIIGSR